MAISEAIVNKIKVLLYEDKKDEAEAVLVSETGLSPEESHDYIIRLEETLTSTKREEPPKSTKKLGIILLVVGVLFAALTAYLYVLKKQSLENSVLTQGVVIGFSYDESDNIWQDNRFDDDVTYAPIITYEVDGKTYRNVSDVASYPPAFDVNEKVEVYINKGDPYDMTINTFMNKWFLVLFMIIFAVVFSLIGIIMLVLNPSSTGSTIDMFDHDEERMVSLDD